MLLIAARRAARIPPLFFWAVFAIPLPSTERWHALEYSKKRANQVTHSPAGLKIEVRDSASPLFYALPGTVTIRSLKATGNVTGLPSLPAGSVEGIGNADDYALRLGIVCEGDHHFNWLQRLFAPNWLRYLATLDPDRGVGKILFFKIAQTETPGSERAHPKNDAVLERVAMQMKTPGTFTLEEKLTAPLPVMALWIQTDGDDTKSSFDLNLSSIELYGETTNR